METSKATEQRNDLLTKPYLDVRLLQHTLAIVAAFAAIVGLFKMLG